MNIRRHFVLALVTSVALLATGCRTSMPTNPEPQLSADGVVRYKSFEGGFYAIETLDGQHLDPLNLPADYQREGLPVHVTGVVLTDYASTHMYGSIFRISEITQR